MDNSLRIWLIREAMTAEELKQQEKRQKQRTAKLLAARQYAAGVRAKWREAGKLPPIIHKGQQYGEAGKDRSTD